MGAGSTGSSNSWKPIAADATLAGPIRSVGAGNVPAGGDLGLDIGWDNFEKLVVEIARHLLGLNQFRCRRYGTAGQRQHGVDIVGRQPDGTHAVVQCKDVQTFTAKSLRDAVDHFANGRRPFAAKQLVVATSSRDTGKTQVQDELEALQKKYAKDFDLDLWVPSRSTPSFVSGATSSLGSGREKQQRRSAQARLFQASPRQRRNGRVLPTRSCSARSKSTASTTPS